jgi:hypothetical protein
MAVTESDYTTLGALYALWGGTPIPKKVSFKCVVCAEIFDETTELAEIRQFVRC